MNKKQSTNQPQTAKDIKGKKDAFREAFENTYGYTNQFIDATSDYEIFKAGINFALKQKQPKVPALEKTPEPLATKHDPFFLAFDTETFGDYNKQDVDVTKTLYDLFTFDDMFEPTLDQADLQYTTWVFKNLISAFEEHLKVMERDIAYLWDKCDPTDPSTKGYFLQLNSTKDAKRKLLVKLNRMRKIQSVLKKHQRG